MALEDYLHPFRHLYRASPRWFKRSVGRVYAALPMRVRYGKTLAEARKFLDVTQFWSWEEHRDYQWRRMKALLEHVYQQVPYYRRVMQERGLTPDDFRSQDDWPKLPCLTKDLIREHKEELVAENLRNRCLPANTGGSTGQPLEIYWERGRTRSLERAFMWRQWAWAGYIAGKKTVVIRGQKVKEGLWHYDPIDRVLFVNSYNLGDEAMAQIVTKLRRYRPMSLQAYPSTMTLLALWLRNHRQPPIEGVKAILCGSENLYPEQKKLFQEVFQARVYSWYGHGESCCQAGWCEKQDLYHVYSEYGYLELADEAGNVLPWTPGARGEMVGTTLINNAMPLIRYRSGDVAVAGPEKCTCGRNYRLLERIEGRKQEYVVTADGRVIALTALVFGQHWHAFAKIKQIQLVQDTRGVVLVRLVKDETFNEHDEKEIRQQMMNVVKHGLEVRFEYPDFIPPTARGKHVFVRQSLPLPGAWSGSADYAKEADEPSAALDAAR